MANPAPIYVPDDAPEANIWAANYLADRIEDACGARPTVTEQSVESSYPQRSILVGYPYESSKNEEICIHNPGDGPLTLTGVDDYRGGYEIAGRTHDTDYMNRGGTVDAVMEFCRRYMGVVAAWPGDLGRFTPDRPTLRVNKIDFRHTPSAKARSSLGFSRAGVTSPYGISKEWMKENGAFHCLQFDIGHSFTVYYDRFHPDGDPGGDNPEIFALQPDGTRGTFPTGKAVKMEVSEPSLIPVWKTVNVDEALAFNPGQEVFGSMANDGYLSGHTRDPRALALDYRGSDAAMYTYSYSGQSITDVVITDRDLWFSNQCASELGEGQYTTFAAYGPSRFPPKQEKPADNTVIVNVANSWNWKDTQGGLATANFDDWLSWSPKNQVWRANLGFGSGFQHGFPNCHYHEWGETYKHILGRGCIGFLPDAFWEHHSTQWLTYWLLARISWDRTIDLDEEVSRVCNAMFGPAGPNIKAYYDAAETAIMSHRVHNASHEDLKIIWRDAALTTMQGHLDSAAAAVESGSDQEKRVEWVQAGLDWCKTYMDCINYKDRYLFPYETSGPNLATLANAVESDVNGTTGWTPDYGGSLPQVISEDVEGNGFGFLCDGEANCISINRIAGGEPSELFVFTARVKHIGTGQDDGRWILRIQNKDTPDEWINIYNTDTEYQAVRRAVAGGDRIEFREANAENDGGLKIASVTIEAATEIDIPALETEWQGVVDAAQTAAADVSFDHPPIGNYATRADGVKLPRPGNFDPPTNPIEGFE